MTVNGVDYSQGRPGGAALAKAGMTFVCRYLNWPGITPGAALTVAELADLHAHGLAVVANFEKNQTRALGGRAAGLVDGQQALAAMQALGFPSDRPTYFSVDFDASLGQQPAIDAYLQGCAVALGPARVGVYGGIGPVGRCAANHSAAWYWQTLAWSGGKVSPLAHLYQYQTGSTGAKPINGAAVDYDRALQSDYGQWGQEADVPFVSDTAKVEDWVAVTGHGVLRTWPDRSLTPSETGITKIRSHAEVRTSAADSDWRRALSPTTGSVGYMLRSDYTPVVAGGDATLNAAGLAVLKGAAIVSQATVDAAVAAQKAADATALAALETKLATAKAKAADVVTALT